VPLLLVVSLITPNQAGAPRPDRAHIAIVRRGQGPAALNATAALEYLCAPAYRASLRPTRILSGGSDHTRP
jgi:hypothetical protein